MNITKRLCQKVTLLLILLCSSNNPLFAAENDVIKVPVRAYYIFHQDLGKVSVSRDQKSLSDILLAANTIWRQAGIEFYFQEQGFYQPKDLDRYQYNINRDREISALNSICPRTKNGLKGIDLCVVGERSSKKGFYVSNYKVRSKVSGRYRLPPLGRKDSRAPRIVVPIKTKNDASPNVIALARALGSALRLERHKKKFKTVRLMNTIPNKIYFGSDYSKIVLTDEEISKARENALKIAQTP